MANRLCSEPGCDRPHRARGYCGSHWNKHYAKPQAAKEYTCSVCGTAVLRKSGKQWNKVCGQPCWYFSRYGRWPMSLLPVGHPAFECATPESAASADGWAWRVFFRDCAVCGEHFASPHTTSTCSAECARAKGRLDARRAKDKRRALERSAYVEPVDRRHVYERDGWLCHLCKKRVDASREVPHPLAPTIDHVVPLSKGGTHELANVRTAHFICNTRKGNRGGGEQLMLVG